MMQAVGNQIIILDLAPINKLFFSLKLSTLYAKADH